jgi:methionyl-tRNA formyltransferase
MKPFPPLVYFGSDDFSAGILERLLSNDDFKSSLKYVVTKTPRTLGRGQHTTPTAVETLARSASNATIVHANSRAELDEALDKLELDTLKPMGVLVSYGVIISDHTLAKFEPGIINFHPSHLPLYRGPSPVESALLRGDRTIGLSIMKLVHDMDAGPVFMQAAVELGGNETRNEAYDRIIEFGAPLFYSTLKRIAEGSLQPTEQEHDKATYTRLIKKQDGDMRVLDKTADELEREVRVFLGFPKSRTILSGHPVIVTKAHVAVSKDSAPIVIECRDNTFLAIDELIAPSGRSMSSEAFLRGYAA